MLTEQEDAVRKPFKSRIGNSNPREETDLIPVPSRGLVIRLPLSGTQCPRVPMTQVVREMTEPLDPDRDIEAFLS
jgi:hypothetical protein